MFSKIRKTTSARSVAKQDARRSCKSAFRKQSEHCDDSSSAAMTEFSASTSRSRYSYNSSYHNTSTAGRTSSMPCLSVQVPSSSAKVEATRRNTASMLQARAAVEALDFKVIEAVKQSWNLVTQVPGDYKQQLGKQVLFTVAGLEKNTCEILGLESVLRPPAKVFSTSRGFAKALNDIVSVLGPDADPLMAIAPTLERRGFCMALLPAFCQAVPTAVRRMLHGDWNEEMEASWKAVMECVQLAIGAQIQTEEATVCQLEI